MLENLESLSTWAVLGIGLVFGLKHATEVDHVVAVSTIVSQHKNVFRSALVGLLWGARSHRVAFGGWRYCARTACGGSSQESVHGWSLALP